MSPKLAKFLSCFLVVLLLSSVFEFPFHFRVSIVRAMKEAEEIGEKMVLSQLSYQQDPMEQLKKEGILYCVNPMNVDGKYEYYLWISNPHKKRISLAFKEVIPHGGTVGVKIEYWEPQFPEENVEVKDDVLSTTDELVFRSFQLSRNVMIVVQQIGGDQVPIYAYKDCKEFIGLISYLMSSVTLETLNKAGFPEASRMLMIALVQFIRDAVDKAENFLREGAGSRVIVIGDSGFEVVGDRPLNIYSVMKIINPNDRIVILGDFVELYGDPAGFLSEAQIQDIHKFLNEIKNRPNVITLVGNHEIQFITTGKYELPPFSRGAAVSGKIPMVTGIVDDLMKLPLMVIEGDTLFAHILTPELLELAFEEDLFNKPLEDWARALIRRYPGKIKMAKGELDVPNVKDEGVALWILGRDYILEHDPKNYPTKVTTALEQFGDELKKRGIRQVVVGHDRIIEELDGKKIKDIEVQVFWKRWGRIDVASITFITADGQMKTGELSKVAEETLPQAEKVTKIGEALEELNNKVQSLLRDVSSDEFVREDFRKGLIEDINSVITLVKKMKDEGKIPKEKADDLLSILSYMERTIEGRRLGDFKHSQLWLSGTLRITIDELNTDAIPLVYTLSVSLEKFKRVYTERIFSTLLECLNSRPQHLQFVLHLLNQEIKSMGDVLKDVAEKLKTLEPDLQEVAELKGKIINIESVISHIEEGKIDEAINILKSIGKDKLGVVDVDKVIEHLEKNENNEAIRKLESGKSTLQQTYERKRFSLQEKLNGEIEEARGGDKIRAETAFILQNYLGPTMSVLNEKLKLLSNQKGISAWLKRNGLRSARVILQLEGKIDILESKLSVLASSSRKLQVAGMTISMLLELYPIGLAILRDWVGEYHPLYQTANVLMLALIASQVVRAVLMVSSLIVGLLMGTVTLAQLGAALLMMGIGFFIGFMVSAVIILAFCQLFPDSSACLCDFRDAKFALVKKGESPKDYSPKIDATVQFGETYTFYAIHARGRACDGTSYKLVLMISHVGKIAESTDICIMTCDTSGNCACSTTITMPQQTRYSVPLLYLSPVVKVEDFLDPRKWASVLVGMVTLSSKPTPPLTTTTLPQPPPTPTISLDLKCDENVRKCTLTYSNKIDESFVVRFYLVDPSSRKVLEIEEKTIPARASGQVQTKQFGCPLGGKVYNVLIQLFKSSDVEFANPLISPLTIGEVKC